MLQLPGCNYMENLIVLITAVVYAFGCVLCMHVDWYTIRYTNFAPKYTVNVFGWSAIYELLTRKKRCRSNIHRIRRAGGRTSTQTNATTCIYRQMRAYFMCNSNACYSPFISFHIHTCCCRDHVLLFSMLLPEHTPYEWVAPQLSPNKLFGVA